MGTVGWGGGRGKVGHASRGLVPSLVATRRLQPALSLPGLSVQRRPWQPLLSHPENGWGRWGQGLGRDGWMGAAPLSEAKTAPSPTLFLLPRPTMEADVPGAPGWGCHTWSGPRPGTRVTLLGAPYRPCPQSLAQAAPTSQLHQILLGAGDGMVWDFRAA